MTWDPALYEHYAAERYRPFFDLIGRVGATAPGRVIDLGCGTGELTASLTRRWPAAVITGIDSSTEMLSRSGSFAGGTVGFELGRAEDFTAAGVDVLVSNATLQWVPDHLDLLARWASELNPGGWLAFGVPANFGAPSHVLMRELATSPRWRERSGSALRHGDAVREPARSLDLLARNGLQVDAWQTEYLHVLPGPDPVLDWVSGTGLRPILAVLDEGETAEFRAEYGAALRAAYPQNSYGTVFAFTRTFVVAHKPG